MTAFDDLKRDNAELRRDNALMAAEVRRLRSRLRRAQEDVEMLNDRLGYAQVQIHELRRRLPDHQRQAAPPLLVAPRNSDPLERLFGALRP